MRLGRDGGWHEPLHVMNKEEIQKELADTNECGDAVMNCPKAVKIVAIENKFQPWKHGAWSHCRFCPSCLRKSQSFTPSEEEIRLCHPWDAALVAKLKEARKERRKHLYEFLSQVKAFETETADAAWWREYNEYLSTQMWKGKRAQVIARCKNICEGCLSETVYQVHHLTYANLGDELLFQLVGLCKACHEKCHTRKNTTHPLP